MCVFGFTEGFAAASCAWPSNLVNYDRFIEDKTELIANLRHLIRAAVPDFQWPAVYRCTGNSAALPLSHGRNSVSAHGDNTTHTAIAFQAHPFLQSVVSIIHIT